MAIFINLILAFLTLYLLMIFIIKSKNIPIDSTQDKPGSSLAEILILLFFGIYAIYVLFTTKNEFKVDSYVNHYFLSTQCQITDTKIVTSGYNKSRTYNIIIQGQYTIEGNQYTGEILLNLTDYSSRFEEPEIAIQNKYQKGQTYLCYYDPNNYRVVILEKGFPFTFDRYVYTTFILATAVWTLLRNRWE